LVRRHATAAGITFPPDAKGKDVPARAIAAAARN